MSERISIVVPDGTRLKLRDRALKYGHTQSALSRKILLDALKCDHDFQPFKEHGFQESYELKCSKCGSKP